MSRYAGIVFVTMTGQEANVALLQALNQDAQRSKLNPVMGFDIIRDTVLKAGANNISQMYRYMLSRSLAWCFA